MASTSDKGISHGALVCVESRLRGNISVGPGSVLHPMSCIIADGGSIIIGECNLFEEKSLVRHNASTRNTNRPDVMIIGSNNAFEVGCTVLAKVIGNNNVFESKCYVGPDVEVGNGCIIGAGVKLELEERLPDNLIITGSNCNRYIASNKLKPQTDQLDMLTKILPNFHYIRKLKGKTSL